MTLKVLKRLHRAVSAVSPRRSTPGKTPSGPGNWIQTRPRKLETVSPLRTVPAPSIQAPDTGNNIRTSGIVISFMGKAMEGIQSGLKTACRDIAPPGARDGHRALVSGCPTQLGAPQRFLGYATIGALLGASAITPRAGAAPGDLIGRETLSTSKNPTGVSYNPSNEIISWITDQGHIYTGKDGAFSLETIVPSVSESDAWKFLTERNIGGTRYFATLNDTTNYIYIGSRLEDFL